MPDLVEETLNEVQFFERLNHPNCHYLLGSKVRVLRCDSVCCSVLQCAAVCCSVLYCVAVCCSVLQCVVVCCIVLQCLAVSCREKEKEAGRTPQPP